jgi:hypothetical protein
MSKIRATWAVSLVFLATVAAAQEPEILVELQRTEVYLGESVRYAIVLNQFENDAVPEMPESDDFRLKLVQKSAVNDRSIRRIGRRTERIVRRGPRLVYELTPLRAGRLAVTGPTAEIDGRVIRGKATTLQVVAPPEQGLVRLRLSADPPVVYPTQSFVLRLELLVRGLPGSASRQDPLTVQRELLPTLSLPWGNDEEIPAGLEPEEPWDRWIRQFNPSERQGGVSINNLQGQQDLISQFFGGDPFGGRGSARRENRIGFRPSATQEMGNDLGGAKAEYWRYVFDRRFEAKEAGNYAFGPASIKGVFGNNDLKLQAIYTLAAPIEVTVREPPVENRPAEYVGAIGRFDCGADIAPSSAKVGDPMTLSIWIRGRGTLADAVAPQLQENAAITDHFKVYDATEDLRKDVCTFTYSVRPKSVDATSFPAVAMAYFDADADQYVTLRTDPLPVQIAAAEQLRQADIAVASRSSSSTDDIELSTGGVFANVTDLDELRDETVRPDRWFLGLGSMAGLFLILVVARQRVGRRADNSEWKRRRQGAGRARQRISEVRRQLATASPNEVADQLSQTFVGLVADTSNSEESGLTSAEAIARLGEFQVGEELVERCRTLLDRCDAIRYGAAAGDLGELVDQAHELAESLIQTLRKQKRLP